MANAVKDELRSEMAKMAEDYFELYRVYGNMVDRIDKVSGAEHDLLERAMYDNIDKRDCIVLELFALIKGAKIYAPKNADIRKLDAVKMWRVCRNGLLLWGGAEALDRALANAKVWTAEA